MDLNKRKILDIIHSIPEGEQRRKAIERSVHQGDLSEADLAAFIALYVTQNARFLIDLIQSDANLRYIRELYQDSPNVMARMFVEARPDIFWHLGIAFRAIMRLGYDVGPVSRRPVRSNGPPTIREINPLKNLDQLTARNILLLGIEHEMRRFLWLYAEDSSVARVILTDERKNADEYQLLVLDGVEKNFERLLSMKFPGVSPMLLGRMFPSIHVRWWIESMHSIFRVLNIGDTGTYKTSFGFVGLDYYGMKHVLVICPAGARINHKNHAADYFDNGKERIQVLTSRDELPTFIQNFNNVQFSIIGWSALSNFSASEMDDFLNLPFDGVFIDECQYGKNTDGVSASARAVSLMRIKDMKSIQRVIACSATPAENGPEEMAGIASIIRPDLFPDSERFLTSGLQYVPRVIREVFASNVLDLELREIQQLPPIEPKPWEDLFGDVPVEVLPDHRRILDTLKSENENELNQVIKTRKMIEAVMHPALVRNAHSWDAATMPLFHDWQLSSKLVWLVHYINAHIKHAKIAIGTGNVIKGITQPIGEDLPWVGGVLRALFGEDQLLIIDGTVNINTERERIKRQWQSRSDKRILLFSMLTAADSINLTVPKHMDVDELRLVFFGLGWKPPKQVHGRFYREGLKVPLKYVTPILEDTIDDALLRFNQDKWRSQQLLRATVPLTAEEQAAFEASTEHKALRVLSAPAWKKVILTFQGMRGRGEAANEGSMSEKSGLGTKGAALARDFFASQDTAASGNFARLIAKAAKEMFAAKMISPERILDAGCGTCNQARAMNEPIIGRDNIPEMIALAKEMLPALAVNSEVGRLTSLPTEWTGKFELTICSLVLDLNSADVDANGISERLRILRELVRVTHAQGQIWITFTKSAMTDKVHETWCRMFEKNRFVIDRSYSGKVVVDKDREKMIGWAILMSPAGHSLNTVRAEDLKLDFEIGQMVSSSGHGNGEIREKQRISQAYQDFAVIPRGNNNTAITDEEATNRFIVDEAKRWASVASIGGTIGRTMHISKDRFGDLHWRALQKLVDAGIIKL